jgi:hypothetical protein
MRNFCKRYGLNYIYGLANFTAGAIACGAIVAAALFPYIVKAMS